MLKKLDMNEVFAKCCEMEDVYFDLAQIKVKVTGLFSELFQSLRRMMMSRFR